MFCPKCGTQQPATVRACIKCNSPLSTTTKLDFFSQTPQNYSQPLPNTQSSSQPLPNLSPNAQPYQNQNVSTPLQKSTLDARLGSNPLPPWNDSIERPKFVYPSSQIQPLNSEYQVGQFLQPYQTPHPDFYNSPSLANSVELNASSRAIWSLVFSILSFAFCPIVGALIGFTLSYQELDAIEKGLSSPAGKTVAQAGFYLSIVNLCLYGIGAFLFLLFVSV